MHQTNGKAVASLVCGIVAIIAAITGWGSFLTIALAIVGIVLGVNARKEIGVGGPDYGLATAGMICSIVSLAVGAVVLVACVACVACSAVASVL